MNYDELSGEDEVDFAAQDWKKPEDLQSKRAAIQELALHGIDFGRHGSRADALARYETAYAERPRPNGALFKNWFLEGGVMWCGASRPLGLSQTHESVTLCYLTTEIASNSATERWLAARLVVGK